MADVKDVRYKLRYREDAKDGEVGVEDLVEQRWVVHPLEEEVQPRERNACEERHQNGVLGRQALHVVPLVLLFIIARLVVILGV